MDNSKALYNTKILSAFWDYITLNFVKNSGDSWSYGSYIGGSFYISEDFREWCKSHVPIEAHIIKVESENREYYQLIYDVPHIISYKPLYEWTLSKDSFDEFFDLYKIKNFLK